MSQYDEGGSEQSDGMFASFDSQPAGDEHGLDYQSFSGLDSGGGDLNLGGGGSLDMNGVGGGADANANDMIGQRNENSVLFSLSSLQQVEAVTASGGGGGGGESLTEGSGLIDIQALASSHAAMKGSGVDDVLGGASPETFSPGTMSVPAIMPRGSHRSNKGLVIAVAALAILLVGGMGFLGYMVLSKEDQPDKPAQVIVQKETIIKEVTREPVSYTHLRAHET